MGWFREHPYAAKARIEHEIMVGFCYVWLTFRLPMDQTQKPADGLWIVTTDGVPKAVVNSLWIDEFTLRLLPVATPPVIIELYVEYDGPSPLLTTTWNKQWEPWGPILSIDITS